LDDKEEFEMAVSTGLKGVRGRIQINISAPTGWDVSGQINGGKCCRLEIMQYCQEEILFDSIPTLMVNNLLKSTF